MGLKLAQIIFAGAATATSVCRQYGGQWSASQCARLSINYMPRCVHGARAAWPGRFQAPDIRVGYNTHPPLGMLAAAAA